MMLTGAALVKVLLALVSSLPQLLKFLAVLHEEGIRREEEQQGYTRAIAEGLTNAMEGVKKAQEARAEASAAHEAHPDDDTGFLPGFQRGKE